MIRRTAIIKNNNGRLATNSRLTVLVFKAWNIYPQFTE
jgi:hypothetical protein